MCVGDQTGDQIDQEIPGATMTSMGDLRDVLQLVIDGLNEGSLAQQELVLQGEQAILHVLANWRDELQAQLWKTPVLKNEIRSCSR